MQGAPSKVRQLRRFLFWFAAVIFLAIFLGKAAKNSHSRTPLPVNLSADAKSLVDGNTEFALDLYQKLRNRPGNLFCSPCSISMAMAMAYGGARGTTESE